MKRYYLFLLHPPYVECYKEYTMVTFCNPIRNQTIKIFTGGISVATIYKKRRKEKRNKIEEAVIDKVIKLMEINL